MKKILMLLAAAVCFTGFYSCEPDEEEPNPTTPPTENPPAENYLAEITVEKLKAISGYSESGVDSLMKANGFQFVESMSEQSLDVLLYASTEVGLSHIMYMIYTAGGTVLGTGYMELNEEISASLNIHKELGMLAKNFANGLEGSQYGASVYDNAGTNSEYTTDTEYYQVVETLALETNLNLGLEMYLSMPIMMQNLITASVDETGTVYNLSLTYLDMTSMLGKQTPDLKTTIQKALLQVRR